MTFLLVLLAGLALVLGAVGVYGVVTQFVRRRQRDWSIRIALGLRPGQVVTRIVTHGGLLVAGVLLAVLRVDEEAYGMNVRREIEAVTGREVAIGAVYARLDRLEAKGLVASGRVREAAGSRRVFSVTGTGARALADTREIRDRLWEGVRLQPLLRTPVRDCRPELSPGYRCPAAAPPDNGHAPAGSSGAAHRTSAPFVPAPSRRRGICVNVAACEPFGRMNSWAEP
jgi:PadR family transcriptional regulator, regulatory protein PadR